MKIMEIVIELKASPPCVSNVVSQHAVLRGMSNNGERLCLNHLRLWKRSFQEIDASDIVLVDLTEKGVGIGIEAGYAFAKHIPVITIAQIGSSISTTLQGISQHILLYSQYADIKEFLATIQR